MPFQPMLLWSDLLIILLFVMVGAFARYTLSQPHLREPWAKVARSGVAMASLTVLALFLVVGVLDSIHFRRRLPDAKTAPAPGKPDAPARAVYGVEVLSVLDALAAPLRERKEKTYSAPFATHAFAKESVEQSDGTTRREFPRLKHGGAHLADPEGDWVPDLARRALWGFAMAFILWLLVAAVVAAAVGRRAGTGLHRAAQAIARGHTELAWRAVLGTLAVVGALLGPALALAGFNSGHVRVGMTECVRIECDESQRDRVRKVLEGVSTTAYDGSLQPAGHVVFEDER